MSLDLMITNHPVHIMAQDNKISPSAFIPFCEFGGNMSGMGMTIDIFNVPVCKCFQAKIKDDQLCYEVDLNRFTDKDNVDKELKLGFYFVMDYNEDRQVNFFERNTLQNMNKGLASSLTEIDQDQHAFIYLNTIGEIKKKIVEIISF